MKNTEPKLTEAYFKKKGYYQERNKNIVSFTLDDIDLKERLKAVADGDGRSVNSWINHYILPDIEAKIAESEKKKPTKPAKR